MSSTNPQRIISFAQFVEEDGAKAVEELALSRLRPRPSDDSKDLPPHCRRPGDPVELYYTDAWWEGFVKDRWSDRISVYFPGKQSKCRMILSDPNKRTVSFTIVEMGFVADGMRLVLRAFGSFG
jgi:hypothetical protein